MIRNQGRYDMPASGASADPSRAREAPIGFVDLPAETETTASNAVVLMGWALDRKAVRKVSIEREPRPGDKPGDLNPRGMVTVGEAAILNGERPDVSAAYPDYPHLYRAQWSFELRREAISQRDKFRIALHAIAQNDDGLVTDLGKREIHFELADAAPPYLFCARPFDSVFVDAFGDVYPYPDCRPERPFGSLAVKGASFEDIWFGRDFMDLRQRIIDRDPPPMCTTCAHFINRNVDDLDYFRPR